MIILVVALFGVDNRGVDTMVLYIFAQCLCLDLWLVNERSDSN